MRGEVNCLFDFIADPCGLFHRHGVFCNALHDGNDTDFLRARLAHPPYRRHIGSLDLSREDEHRRRVDECRAEGRHHIRRARPRRRKDDTETIRALRVAICCKTRALLVQRVVFVDRVFPSHGV